MQSLPTVLLRHTSRENTHFDWMLADPRDPSGKLWTARCQYASSTWASLQTWLLEPLVPHRREYLSYQGAISEGRGWVERVDQGTFVAEKWGTSRRLIVVELNELSARIELTRLSATLWRATTLHGSRSETCAVVRHSRAEGNP